MITQKDAANGHAVAHQLCKVMNGATVVFGLLILHPVLAERLAMSPMFDTIQINSLRA